MSLGKYTAFRFLLLLLFGLGIVHLAVSISHRIYNTPSSGDHTFQSDFESGDFSLWENKGAVHICCEDSIVVVESPARTGKRAAQFSLRRDDPDVNGSRRAEIRMKAGMLGSEYWHAFSIFLPADWAEDSVATTVAQWHAVPDKLLGEAGRSPPFRLLSYQGMWQLASIWDSKRVSQTFFTKNDPEGALLDPIGPLDKNKWTDWVFHIRWSYQDDGIIEVWKDGEQVYHRKGPNTYNDALGPYLKLGIYVPEWSVANTVSSVEHRTAYFDAIRVTDKPSTYLEMTQQP